MLEGMGKRCWGKDVGGDRGRDVGGEGCLTEWGKEYWRGWGNDVEGKREGVGMGNGKGKLRAP